MYEKYGDKLILDSYVPDDGEYIIVCYDEPFQILDKVLVKLDKDTRTIDRTNKYMDFICEADYYSKYLNSNKSVANKNIHSNNFLSFYTRIEGIQEKKVDDDAITGYYDYFRYPENRLNGKTEERLLYKNYEDNFGKISIDKVNRIERWIKGNLFNLIDFQNTQGAYRKSFLRILFYSDIEEYEKEGNRYFLTRLYNTNTYNIEIDGLIYGLPDNNMGLNEKKLFLKNHTRKNKIPHYLSQKDVITQKKLFDYLGNQFELGKRYIYFDDVKMIPKSNTENLSEDFNGVFFSIRKGQKEIEIQEYDNITGYKYLIRPIKFENVLNINNERSIVEYGNINTITKAREVINEVLFSKFLVNNYFTEPKSIKISDVVIRRSIISDRTVLFSWFYKGNEEGVWKLLKRSTTELILSSITNNHFNKACERFNLKMALKTYFEGGEEMADVVMEIKDKLRSKINSSGTEDINDDNEYYFAVGQAIYYFISLSKSGNKKLSLANTILNSKTDKKIKEDLKKLFIKYNHSIDISSKRFKNLYSMIASYETEGKVNQDLLIAGYLHSNLIFEKSGKDSDDTNKEEEK